jgi:hypothetical protein
VYVFASQDDASKSEGLFWQSVGALLCVFLVISPIGVVSENIIDRRKRAEKLRVTELFGAAVIVLLGIAGLWFLVPRIWAGLALEFGF